jgi:hypothetical protein
LTWLSSEPQKGQRIDTASRRLAGGPARSYARRAAGSSQSG